VYHVELVSFPQPVQKSVPDVQVQNPKDMKVQNPKDMKVMTPVDVDIATNYFLSVYHTRIIMDYLHSKPIEKPFFIYLHFQKIILKLNF